MAAPNADTSDVPVNTRKPPLAVLPVRGIASTTPTASAPGIDRSLAAISSTCCTRRAFAPSSASGGKKPWSSTGGWYNRIAATPSDRKPGSVSTSRIRLRVNSPAPTSNATLAAS
jgi:hypothetical protein